MPKLPVIKANRLLKTLKKLGFYEYHQVGSHIQLKHSDGRRTTIPYHPAREIRRGTLKAIIDDLDMTVEEFIKAIKKIIEILDLTRTIKLTQTPQDVLTVPPLGWSVLTH